MSINPYYYENKNRFDQAMAARIGNRFHEERIIQMNYKSMQDRWDTQIRDRARRDQTDLQQMRQRCEKDIPEMQASINELMNNSMLNGYADSSIIERIDLQAYKFLVLRKDEFWELRSLKCTRKGLQKREIQKQALPFLGLISGLTLVFSCPFAGAIALPIAIGSGMCISTGSGLTMLSTAHRLQEEEADDRAILKANIEELKGGIRFFKACQKVYQIRDHNGGLFDRLFLSLNSGFGGQLFSTSSEESWLPSLAVDPSWKDRITKIEKKLQARGEDISAMQEDQGKIDLLEKFV